MADDRVAADPDAKAPHVPAGTADPGTAGPDSPDPEPYVRPSRLPTLILAAALTVAVAAVVTVAVLGARARARAAAPDTGPVAVAAAPAPGASGRYCTALMPALPGRLVSQDRRPLADSQPGVAAWGDPAVILRCGLMDPAELTCSSELMQFTDASGGSVAWLRLSDPSAVTYIAVDRPVRIAVTLPAGTGPGPIQQLSQVIAARLPLRPVCTNGSVVLPDNA